MNVFLKNPFWLIAVSCSLHLLVNLVCSPQSLFPFRKKSYQICRFPVLFGISSALHDYSGMSFAGQSVPFTVTFSLPGWHFLPRPAAQERALRHSDSCFCFNSFCKCLPQIFQFKTSFFVKNTATTRWQHPCDARFINTTAAQA